MMIGAPAVQRETGYENVAVAASATATYQRSRYQA